MIVVCSSGHGKYVRGASGYLDEVDEARRVVEAVAGDLRALGVEVVTYHDDISRSQSENLNRIVQFHNAQTRDLDVSVHFNAYQTTDKPMGTECLYVSQKDLAAKVSAAIAGAAGLPNRGAKYRNNLAFLNNTNKPAILIEVCFVDSSVDAKGYHENFAKISTAIAETIAPPVVAAPAPPAPSGVLFKATGKCSWFGGPSDSGVSPDEGLAFIYSVDQAPVPNLFLPYQPSGTTGLARRLNADEAHYIACRWDYAVTSKEFLRSGALALVTAQKTGISLSAVPADWGPNSATGRVADLSPKLLKDLGIATDDIVEVKFPWREELIA